MPIIKRTDHPTLTMEKVEDIEAWRLTQLDNCKWPGRLIRVGKCGRIGCSGWSADTDNGGRPLLLRGCHSNQAGKAPLHVHTFPAFGRTQSASIPGYISKTKLMITSYPYFFWYVKGSFFSHLYKWIDLLLHIKNLLGKRDQRVLGDMRTPQQRKRILVHCWLHRLNPSGSSWHRHQIHLLPLSTELPQ